MPQRPNLGSLPNELLLEIIRAGLENGISGTLDPNKFASHPLYLANAYSKEIRSRETVTTLYNLCLVSRRLRAVTQTVLFEEFAVPFTFDYVDDMDEYMDPAFNKAMFQYWHDRLACFVNALVARPDLAGLVKRAIIVPNLIHYHDVAEYARLVDWTVETEMKRRLEDKGVDEALESLKNEMKGWMSEETAAQPDLTGEEGLRQTLKLWKSIEWVGDGENRRQSEEMAKASVEVARRALGVPGGPSQKQVRFELLCLTFGLMRNLEHLKFMPVVGDGDPHDRDETHSHGSIWTPQPLLIRDLPHLKSVELEHDVQFQPHTNILLPYKYWPLSTLTVKHLRNDCCPEYLEGLCDIPALSDLRMLDPVNCRAEAVYRFLDGITATDLRSFTYVAQQQDFWLWCHDEIVASSHGIFEALRPHANTLRHLHIEALGFGFHNRSEIDDDEDWWDDLPEYPPSLKAFKKLEHLVISAKALCNSMRNVPDRRTLYTTLLPRSLKTLRVTAEPEYQVDEVGHEDDDREDDEIEYQAKSYRNIAALSKESFLGLANAVKEGQFPNLETVRCAPSPGFTVLESAMAEVRILFADSGVDFAVLDDASVHKRAKRLTDGDRTDRIARVF